MKKTVLLGILALTATAFADGDIAYSSSNNNQMNSRQNNQMQAQPTKVVLTSARPESANGWYLFADALYWHADVGSTDWAYKNTSTDLTAISGPNHSLNFKWDWGYRVGIGANMDYDQWDANAYYTYFQTHNSNAAATDNGDASDLFNLVETAGFTQGKINWGIHFSMFDGELGRWFYVSKHISLRPHVGLKGGWIHQTVREKIIVDPLSTTGIVASAKNRFWGVGPSGGVNTNWHLGHVGSHHFDLFGDFAGAIMYGHFQVSHKEDMFLFGSPTPAILTFHPTNLSRNLAVPMLQAMFGFSWDTGFNRDRNHFTLRASYEFQYWFRQNQMIINADNTGAIATYQRAHDDLALQGLTLDLRFDF